METNQNKPNQYNLLNLLPTDSHEFRFKSSRSKSNKYSLIEDYN